LDRRFLDGERSTHSSQAVAGIRRRSKKGQHMRRQILGIAAAVSLMFFIMTLALSGSSYQSPWVINRHALGDFRVEALRGKLSLAGPMVYVYPSASKTVGFAGFTYITSTMQSIVILPLWSVLLVTIASFITLRRLSRIPEKPGICPT
jgi:hypothetical protein